MEKHDASSSVSRRTGARFGAAGLGITVLTVALIAALLTSSTTAGSSFVPRGQLELVANDTDGDGFVFTPSGGTPLFEEFSSNNQSRLIETPATADLTELIPAGRGSGGQLYVGLKDHRIGVRAQGEGNGTPAVQINNVGIIADNQSLTIKLNGSDLGGAAATNGQIALKMKFGATARLRPLFEGAPIGDGTLVECSGGSGSDCGPDSDGDLKTGLVGDGSYLFDAVEISIDQPEDGAVSLVSTGSTSTWFNIAEPADYDLSVTKVVDDATPIEGDTVTYTITVTYEDGNAAATGISVSDVLPTGVAAGTPVPSEGDYNGSAWTGIDLGPTPGDSATLTIPVTVDADTGGTTITNTAWLAANDTRDDDSNDSASVDITPFNGEIECNVAETGTDPDDPDYSYSFLRLGALDEDCEILKPFNADILVGDRIEFEPDSTIQSVYRGDLTFPAGSGSAFFAALQYDADGAGPLLFSDMLPCDKTAVTDTSQGSPEVALEGYFSEMGVGFYPALPSGETSCVVLFNTVAGGVENSVVRLDFDPWYR
jgi:uncharacterized repeat protein (TIGR01451 family)